MPLTTTKAPTFPALLLRGILAGVIAGLIAGGFAYLVGEHSIDTAIAIEDQVHHAAGGAEQHPDELVSRDGQRFGLFLATALFGAAMGGLLATAYTLLRRRLRARHDAHAVLTLAAAALLGAVLVPFVKYPANPPAVGNPDTINQRTGSYLAMVVIGLAAVWAAALAYRSVHTAAALRCAAAVGAFVAVTAIGYAALPTVNEVPPEFPASLLWEFRTASLGTQLVLWTGIGLTFATLLPSGTRSDGHRRGDPLSGG
ncbi:CbtA family protein [Micromonospora aurantiaca (nom. illeg.)]|uniref:CbtA family protein n=1 Tax=Micromonospora aurantiaca (nom. illeg.) TaxID=47850 RepID=UPI003F4A1A3F